MNPIQGPGGLGGYGNAAAAARLRSLQEMEPQRGITLRPAADQGPDFASTLADVLGEVNELQLNSDEMIQRFASGQVKDLHEVVIAQQEAAIAFHLIQEVRDKLIQGYQEIMRMQV